MLNDFEASEPHARRQAKATGSEIAGERRHDDVSIRRTPTKSARHIAWRILPLENLMHVRILGAVTPADIEHTAANVMQDDNYQPGLRAFIDLRGDGDLPRSTTTAIAEVLGAQAWALECDRMAVLVTDRLASKPGSYERAVDVAPVPVRVFDDPLTALKWLDEKPRG